MRKILSLIIIVFIISSCGSSDEKKSIEDQIKTYKDEVNQINIKIKELEKELQGMGEGENAQLTPVEAIEVKERPFKHYFQVSGTVEAVDNAFISSEISGQVKELLVHEGENVVKGQELARLNTSIPQNTIEEVKTQLEMATTLFNKQQQLWDKKIGSEVQYLQAKNNKEALESKLQTLHAQLELAVVRSPIDGIVDAIMIEEGEMAMPGFQIMEVVSLNKLKIYADVSEKYLPNIKKGDLVTLQFPTFPNIELEVAVYRTGNVINKSNRTFPVELKIDNIDKQLKPNLLALITFLDYSKEDALVVPSIIIKKDIQGEYIYILKEIDGKQIAKKIYITTGMSYEDETIVESGLSPGDFVITKGYSLITDGTEVKKK